MSIVLQGSTSGSITLQEPAIAGSNTINLPAATGTAVLDTATQTLTNKTLTTPNIDSAQFATVSGTAPIYPCRAWVNFNGTGTVAIRASGNVSSITDNGTGDYVVNYITAMPDGNYAFSGFCGNPGSTANRGFLCASDGGGLPSTTGIRFVTFSLTSNATVDYNTVTLSVFR